MSFPSNTATSTTDELATASATAETPMVFSESITIAIAAARAAKPFDEEAYLLAKFNTGLRSIKDHDNNGRVDAATPAVPKLVAMFTAAGIKVAVTRDVPGRCVLGLHYA